MTGGTSCDRHALSGRQVVAVVRVSEVRDPVALVDALWAGGITAVEFTFTSSNAAEAIRRTRAERPDVAVGAGTIRTCAHLDAAVAAGAQFGVSPHLDPDLVTAANERGLSYIPGVLTPSEVAQALSLGSEMVKIYPARAVGPTYPGDIASVFPGARLMVTGGIGLEDARRYLDAGAEVVGLGGALTAGTDANGDFSEITERARMVTFALAGDG